MKKNPYFTPLKKEFRPFLEPRGYLLDKSCEELVFVKKIDPGSLYIRFVISNYLYCTIGISIPTITKIRDEIKGKLVVEDCACKSLDTIVYGIGLNDYRHAYPFWRSLSPQSHFESAVMEVKDGLESFGFPLLEQHHSEESLLPLLMGEIELKNEETRYNIMNLSRAIIVSVRLKKESKIPQIDTIASEFLDTYKRVPMERYIQYLDYRQKALNYFSITNLPEPPIAQAV